MLEISGWDLIPFDRVLVMCEDGKWRSVHLQDGEVLIMNSQTHDDDSVTTLNIAVDPVNAAARFNQNETFTKDPKTGATLNGKGQVVWEPKPDAAVH